MEQRIKVGFFDSGHGGLSLLSSCQELLPTIEFHYIADCAFHPYGSKTKSEVVERSFSLVKLLIERGCHTIVVACNTATALAIETLREEFDHINFVGIEPYLNIVTKQEFHQEDRLGVIVTPRTLSSERFKNLKDRVDVKNRLDVLGLPLLAPYIEACVSDGKQVDGSELKEALGDLLGKNWSHVILGCTHYPLVKNKLESLLNVKCIDPSHEVAKQLKRVLNEPGTLETSGQRSFWFSNTSNFSWSLKKCQDFFGHL